MELLAYWRLLKRRWLFVGVPALVVLVVGLVTYQSPPPAYNGGIRFIVGQTPSEGATASDEERLANWQTSEYIVNGLTDWSRGGQFAELVSAELTEEYGLAVPPGNIQGSIAVDNTRSMLTFSMSYGDPEILEAMIRASATVLIEQNDLGMPQLGGEPAELVQLDEPIINPISPSLLDQLQLPIRVVLALAAGVGLALLVDYLDPTVRERSEVETLGLNLLGEIPKK